MGRCCCRTMSLSRVSPVMTSCAGNIRRSFCWPTATCSESHSRKTTCSPAWKLSDGNTFYSTDGMSWLNHIKQKHFWSLFLFTNCLCESAYFQLWQRLADTKQHCQSLQWWAAWGVHGDERSPLLARRHTAVEAGSGFPAVLEGRHWPGSTLLPAGLPGKDTLANHQSNMRQLLSSILVFYLIIVTPFECTLVLAFRLY